MHKKTVKLGGDSIMVFGMFSYQGTTSLICLNTQVNATIYKNLLKSHVLPVLNNSDVKDSLFVQHNMPCHKAKSILNFLKEKKVQLLDWPAQSPDLNSIENLWKILGQRIMAKNPINTEELWLKLPRRMEQN